MSGKSVGLVRQMVSLVLVFLSLGLVTNAVGSAILSLAFLLLISVFFIADGALSSKAKSFLLIELLLVIYAMFLTMRIRTMTNLSLCFEKHQVVLVQGRVIYDSTFTTSGNHLMRIMLRRCGTLSGDQGSASGLVSVIGDCTEMISSGTVVQLEGHFSDNLFVYDSLQVLERGRLNAIREYIIPVLEQRLLGSRSSTLSTLLLFGRADYATSDIKTLAQDCGCTHILALSGMHLGILASMCKKLFGDGKLGKATSAVVIFLFVFIAGPRPSLVRAALAFALGFMGMEGRAFAVFALQMLLFPASMTEVGCCYGYAAVFAIVYLSPYIKAALFQWLGKASQLVSASVSVMVLSAPVQMILTGKWHPAAIFASPVAGLLAACSMILGLLLLVFGQIHCLVWMNEKVYEALQGVFSFFGAWPASGWVGYAVFVLCIFAMVSVLIIVRRYMLKCCVHRYSTLSDNWL